MEFPLVFSYDGVETSFKPLSKYTFKGITKKMTLYGNQDSEVVGTPFKIEPQINKKYVSVCKSNLQKCVRRKNIDYALRTGMALFSYSPTELLRRLSIIMIEDTLPHPLSFQKIVWWMCAVSKGYSLSYVEVGELMGIICLMCKSEFFEPKTSSNDLKGFDLSLLSDPDFILAMEVRKEYGGMKCDFRMLEYHQELWCNRSQEYWDLMNNQEEYYVFPDTIGVFSKYDILLEAIDYHPFPWMLKRLPESAKTAIWICRSRINYRKPLQEGIRLPPNKEISEEWDKMKDEVEGLAKWIFEKVL